MTWRFYEPCCGTAAVSMHLCGATENIVSYQGNKWRLRHEVERVIREAAGVKGPPAGVRLFDRGPWGRVADILRTTAGRHAVARRLEDMIRGKTPRQVYDALRGRRTPDDGYLYAAEFLFLQRIAFGGKAVHDRPGAWKTAGYNRDSAEGSDRGTFGVIKPQVPRMIDRLRRATWTIPRLSSAGPMVVYFDPPYLGTTGYGFTMSRGKLVTKALRAKETASCVLVSEAEPIGELVDLGWSFTELNLNTSGKRHNQPARREFITWSR